jgi:hypothetical protein
MFCSRSIGVHLLKGLGAFVLIGLALYMSAYQRAYILITPLLLIGAFLLFRGCPMCWLMGLFETIAKRKNSRLGCEYPAENREGI